MRAVLALSALIGAATANPIKEVIVMIQNLQVKGKEEGEKEQIMYTEFSRWCTDEQGIFSAKIAKSKEIISSLEDAIAGYKAKIEALTATLDETQAELDKRNSDQAEANKLRDEGKDLFEENKKNLEDTIQAVSDALQAIKDSKGETLAQVKNSVKVAQALSAGRLTPEDNKKITAFLEQPGDLENPRVRKYDFKSGNVIELLEGLVDSFKGELRDTVLAENHAINAHELSSKAQANAIQAAEDKKAKLEAIKNETDGKKSDAEADLEAEQNTLSEDEEYLKETTIDCNKRAREFDDRSKSREGEQQALAMAIETLSKASGVRSTDHAHEHDDHSDYGAEPTNFLQMSESPRARAAALIYKVGQKHHNGLIERLAQKVKGSKGAFKEIIEMIQKMVFQLNKEQTDEDNQKLWCDNELETTNQKKDTKEEKKAALEAKIEGLNAKISKLEEQIAAAEEDIADTAQRVKDETKMRNEYHEDLTKSIEDAKKAQQALTAAIATLEKFYTDSGMLSLIQKPELSYGGSFQKTDGAELVLNMLKQTQEDYATMEAQSTAEDESDADKFAQSMSEAKIFTAKKTTEVKSKTNRKNTLSQDLDSAQKSLKKTNNSIEALEQYLKDLEKPCVNGDSTYEERKAARKDEIDGLNEAKKVLVSAFEFRQTATSFLSPRP